MLSFTSRLRTVAGRTAAIASIKPIIKTTAVKSIPAIVNTQRQRTYATKQVAYTVDKFPGYVRNENFAKVATHSHTLKKTNTRKNSSQNKMLII